MRMNQLDSFLFRFRLPILLVVLVFVFYTNIFMWFFTPFTFHEYYWQLDSRAVVTRILSDPPDTLPLEVGDQILQVNDQPVRRMRPVYPLPMQTEYKLTIQRGTDIQDVLVPISAQPNPEGVGYRLPAGVISFIGLLVGAITLLFAQRDNNQALRIGGIFLLAAVTIIGIQGGLFGVPGAWLGGHPLVFFTCIGWLYLGTVPQSEPLSARVRRLFKWLFVLAVILASLAVFEVLVLFQQATSFQEIIGISLYSLGFFLSALCLLVAFLTIALRAFKKYDSPYHRQQIRILMVFVSIGVLPAVFLTILPKTLFDVVFLPFPVAISLLGFIPAGYFYVIYRRGFLELDIIFSRIAIFMILAMIMLLIYGLGLYVLHSQFNFSTEAIMPATLLFLPVLVMTMYSRGPIHSTVQTIFFGQVTTNQAIPTFASALSSKPEISTLQDMVEHLVSDLQTQKAVLLLKDRYGVFVPVARVNSQNRERLAQVTPFYRPQLRSIRGKGSENVLFETYPWAEILLPIIIRDQQVGFLAMANPAPDGYYNAEQVAFLSRAADMIAVGSEAITLFEASRKLSLELLGSREDERRHMASDIHDGPVQRLVFLTQNIRNIRHKAELPPAVSEQLKGEVDELQDIVMELREICAGLYPSFIDQGVKVIAETLTQTFTEEHNLHITLLAPEWDDAMVPPKLCRTVYKVLLESLTNVVKHAQTQDVCIELDYTDSHVLLSVADNGVGCQLPIYSVSELIRSFHTGIVGMFEWADLVNGSLSIQQNEPRGTVVRLEIPLPRFR